MSEHGKTAGGLRPFLRLLQGGLGRRKAKGKAKAWAKCPECGEPHNPEGPHDAEAPQYRARFLMRHGRTPTWLDALAHCEEQTQLDWVLELASMGVPLESDPCE